MKSLIGVLIGVSMLSLISSCATVPKAPLAPGELRLLSMDAVGGGVEANSSFAVNVFFEASGSPRVKRACFYESGEEPSCFDASGLSYFTLATKRAFQVYLPGLNVGTHSVECYVEYIRDGETRKTNVVLSQISAGAAPGH
jgi:hypothetical protein